MAPLDLAPMNPMVEPAVHVAIGVAFGFILEKAGFGSSKKLTSQFYLNDMSVLKVMFTAIITCMVLITATTAVGGLDFEKLWVNPTYLASGIVGGLIFGAGFTLGGYCPGTALVAIATLKLDGLFFILGVLGGIFTFGYTLPWVDHFFNDVTNYGRLTLVEWLGLPMPVVAVLAFAMALGFFAAAEGVESWMRRGQGTATDTPRSHWPRTMAVSLGVLAALTLMLWSPMRPSRERALQASIEGSVTTLKVAVEPEELAELMRDRTIAHVLFDLRPENEFNRFHLLDAQLVAPHSLTAIASVPAKTIKVLISSSEEAAKSTYRQLALRGAQNLYWLHDGMPAWQRMIEREEPKAMLLASALGAEQPASRPPTHGQSLTNDTLRKIKRPGGGAAKSGGCGG
jgi:rhodanese-related sulfurtransferase